MQFFKSPFLVFGERAVEHLRSMDAKRAAIITDKNMVKFGYADKVKEQLEKAGIKTTIFDEVEPEPSVATVKKGAELIKKVEPDIIIGLGGGSAMDAAKTIRLLYENPELSFEDLQNPLLKVDVGKKTVLVTIPTTSGTGAETTWAMVITNPEERRKLELATLDAVADVAIMDPIFTKGLPPMLTACTGLDALTHAVEAYVSEWASDFTDALALGSIRLIFKYLPDAFKNGSDIVAREHMHNAATMAGLAFGNSQAGLAHSLGHSFGALFKKHHGLSVAIMLPYVVQFNSKVASEKYREIAEAIGERTNSDREGVELLVKRIKELIRKVGVPLSIKELGISREEFEENLDNLVDHAWVDFCTPVNPRDPNEEELRKLFMYIYEGRDVDF